MKMHDTIWRCTTQYEDALHNMKMHYTIWRDIELTLFVWKKTQWEGKSWEWDRWRTIKRIKFMIIKGWINANDNMWYIYTHIHKQTHTHIYTHIHTYAHTYTHTYIYIYIYMCVYIYIYNFYLNELTSLRSCVLVGRALNSNLAARYVCPNSSKALLKFIISLSEFLPLRTYKYIFNSIW